MDNSKKIYELPHTEYKNVCRILDQSNKWEELGGKMKFDVQTIQDLHQVMNRGHSPSEELLKKWENVGNHTILELFILLSHMKHYEAMKIIKKFVDDKFHTLMRDLSVDLNIDRRSEKILNVDKGIPEIIINGEISREDNESLIEIVQVKPRSPLLLNRIQSTTMFTESAISCVAESAGAIPQIPYEDLQKSTNGWDQSTILGKGGFGTVFKGTWKCTKVAIKRIECKEDNPESYSEQIKQSITELHCLNAYRHDNVLPLYGYSIGGPQPCLIYQYMSGGSLDYRLRPRDISKALDWNSRLNIAIGTARGLQYLHTIGDKPLIHGDIKSANILLDPNDTPRIGDFGLAREGPHQNYTHITVSRIHGTRPYLPDEFLRAKKFSTKVDTYSFGVVLYEIATSLSAYSEKREHKFLKDHVVNCKNVLELKDGRVAGGDQIYLGLIGNGTLCVSRIPKERPEMVQVLIALEKVGC